MISTDNCENKSQTVDLPEAMPPVNPIFKVSFIKIIKRFNSLLV
jgi:hypothetical protein